MVSDSHRYEAVVRISEAIEACHEPEELATTLADEIGKLLHFDHLHTTVLRESTAAYGAYHARMGVVAEVVPNRTGVRTGRGLCGRRVRRCTGVSLFPPASRDYVFPSV